ncbi:hypothetical protein CMUS01_02287 [Colletotrichum musicola]|uniref:Uncharacterized protein n=1 Tax=Colletotrichum musicola TaxID=2175873 RepID=A0A8H6NVD4_9PEZI|nr:hypothetical protein CMUS01_02287 [Colletotrichum musicola]
MKAPAAPRKTLAAPRKTLPTPTGTNANVTNSSVPKAEHPRPTRKRKALSTPNTPATGPEPKRQLVEAVPAKPA